MKPFPLTLQNAGNYITSDFLSQLEGFEVAVSEDNKTVNVTTNRVEDEDAFLEKMLAAELNSYSANMKIDQKMESSTEELGLINMLMEISMDVVEEPMEMHMLMKMAMDFDGIMEELNFEIKEFYISSKIDKKTLFPLDMTGTIHMTMGMDDETMTIKQIISGTYSNFNTVKEIIVPAEVIKNAISMEEYFEQLGIDFDEDFDFEEELEVVPA